MNTGISADITKTKLKHLALKIEQHGRAINTLLAKYPNDVRVVEYNKKFGVFRDKAQSLSDDADAWTSSVVESTADVAHSEFGLLVSDFGLLAAKMAGGESDAKVAALEVILSKDPKAKAAYSAPPKPVESEARALTPIAAPMVPEGVLPKLAIGSGIVAILLLLRRLFFR